MSYLFSFSRYQTKCVIEFLFKQLMTSWTLRFIFDHPPKQWPTGRKRGKDRNTKNWISQEWKERLDEIKSIFHSFWWKNKNSLKIADATFNNNIVTQSLTQKHLGMFLDTKLDFQEHLKSIFSKVNKTSDLLRKLHHIVVIAFNYKSCLNLCSRKWLRPSLSLVSNLILLVLWHLKTLFPEGCINFNQKLFLEDK